MRGTLLLCTLLGLHLGVINGQWTPASLPNPQTEPGTMRSVARPSELGV